MKMFLLKFLGFTTVKNYFRLYGKICMILGGVSLLLFIIIFLSNNIFQSLFWGTTYFSIFGVVWLVIGICFYIPAKLSDIKRERLKKEGVRYDAEIVQFMTNPFINGYGSVYKVVYAQCNYQNQDGKIYPVKSELYLLNCPKELLNAVVYVNHKDPKDYYVEVTKLQILENNKNI